MAKKTANVPNYNYSSEFLLCFIHLAKNIILVKVQNNKKYKLWKSITFEVILNDLQLMTMSIRFFFPNGIWLEEGFFLWSLDIWSLRKTHKSVRWVQVCEKHQENLCFPHTIACGWHKTKSVETSWLSPAIVCKENESLRYELHLICALEVITCIEYGCLGVCL